MSAELVMIVPPVGWRRAAAPPPIPLDMLLSRIRGAYDEMPGLRLTTRQAARLLGIDDAACGELLDQLRELGFLRLGSRGHYVRADER